MKKRLSVILSLSLAMQPAFGAFEGVKRKVASVKEVMAKSRAVLKENWNCLRHGTGPQCTKEQRSALVIIHDFVTGKWAKAKAGLKEFYKKHETAIKVSSAVIAQLALIAALTGLIVWSDKYATERRITLAAEEYAKDIVPSNTGVDTTEILFNYLNIPLTETREWSKWYPLYEQRLRIMDYLMNKYNQRISSADIALITPLMEQLGWETTFNGKSLPGIIMNDEQSSLQDQISLIDQLVSKGMPLGKWQAKYDELTSLQFVEKAKKPGGWETPLDR